MTAVSLQGQATTIVTGASTAMPSLMPDTQTHCVLVSVDNAGAGAKDLLDAVMAAGSVHSIGSSADGSSMTICVDDAQVFVDAVVADLLTKGYLSDGLLPLRGGAALQVHAVGAVELWDDDATMGRMTMTSTAPGATQTIATLTVT